MQWPIAAAIVFYSIGVIAQLWGFFMKKSGIGYSDWSGAFIGYHLPPGQRMDMYIWVKLFSVELCFVALGILPICIVRSIERHFYLKGKLHAYKSLCYGILAWPVIDLVFWVKCYGTSPYYLLTWVIVELTILIHREKGWIISILRKICHL